MPTAILQLPTPPTPPADDEAVDDAEVAVFVFEFVCARFAEEHDESFVPTVLLVVVVVVHNAVAECEEVVDVVVAVDDELFDDEDSKVSCENLVLYEIRTTRGKE